ncbi:MAG: hypothetical protein ACLR01_06140 [Vescimonas sp.]
MRLCVIGDPVGHSLSPRIHRRFMERCGAAGSYEAVTVTAEALEDFVVQGRRGAWDGCNVTMPLKERILPLLDAVEPWTASCGAVNTVCFRNGRAVGYNTDGPGWWRACGCGALHRRGRRRWCWGPGSRQGGGAGTGAGGLPGDGVRPDTGKGGGLGCPVRRCDCLMGGPAPCRRRAWAAAERHTAGHGGLAGVRVFGFRTGAADEGGGIRFGVPSHGHGATASGGEPGVDGGGGLALLVQQAALAFAHFTGIVPDAALCRNILQELEAAQ